MKFCSLLCFVVAGFGLLNFLGCHSSKPRQAKIMIGNIFTRTRLFAVLCSQTFRMV